MANTLLTAGAGGGGTDTFGTQLFHIQDQQTSGTNGGTFTSGSWAARVLNTSVTNEISGASLSSNQITLPAGTYFVEASAPALACNRNMLRLQNTTDATTTLSGTSTHSAVGDTGSVQVRALLSGRFTIAGTKTFELQHQCQTTSTSLGLGLAVGTSFTVPHETYADIKIWKVS